MRFLSLVLLTAMLFSSAGVASSQTAGSSADKGDGAAANDAPRGFYNGSKEGSLKIVATKWQDAQAKRGDYQWQAYSTRVIEQLKGFKPVAFKFDKYGGRPDITEKATGFYHAAKINGRWWNIDPAGNALINVGLAAVDPGPTAKEKKSLKDTYGDVNGWMKATHVLLVRNGFNAFGGWGNVDALRASPYQPIRPISYTVVLNFTVIYAQHRNYKNTGYPGAWMRGAIPVFDPEYPAAIDAMAKKLVKYKDDENLYGYFIDNELPFTRANLDAYLAMPDNDPGYLAAKHWMADHHAGSPNDKLRAEFLGYEADTYYRITSAAIHKYDPNHMILGSRFTEPEYWLPELFEAAGHYCDVISVNFYSHWTPTQDAMELWERSAHKPFLITEFYTKGMDSGLPNTSGAGWLVHTQEDRGAAYQNVTLQLLQNKGSVGWQYFRYQDNDPSEVVNKWDDSNLDSNKGIVDSEYHVWRPLLDRQRQINLNVYSLIDYFDHRTQ